MGRAIDSERIQQGNKKSSSSKPVKLTLLAIQLCRVHRLAQHLDRQPTRLLEIAILLVVLLQQTLRRRVIRPYACRPPSAVVPTRIAVVELKLPLRVVAGVDERDAKGPQATVLRVSLLQVAQAAHELLAGDLLVVDEQVALCGLARIVDEDVGVGGQAGDGADHVAVWDQG